MGFSISPVMANLFKQEFESNAVNTANHPPKLWLRYVDDIFVIQKAEHSIQFLQHINSINPHIQFIQGTPNTDGSIPFLDTLATPGSDNTLLTTVNRKATHTDQCLHWDSHCNIFTKKSVYNTLTHRICTVCANTQLLHKEEDHIRGALVRYN